jgi:molybdenum cofactor cytidylyltransferase
MIWDVSAILLAAGLSRRMGGQDKLLLRYKGKTLLQHAVDLLDSLPVRQKILVVAPGSVKSIIFSDDICVVVNKYPEIGQSGSLRLGLERALGKSYLFLSADQPLLTLAEVLPVLRFADDHPGKIIFPKINGAPCNPVLFPMGFRGDLMALTGDSGGRVVRKSRPERCFAFEAERPEAFFDIDSEEDYLFLTGGEGTEQF